MSVNDLLALLDEHMELHERLAQTERTKTERAFEAAYRNALFDFKEDVLDALAAQGGAQ